MNVIIDRFEGDFAVVEIDTAQFVNLPKKLLPPKAKEGDVVSIEINEKETKKREQGIAKLMNDVWK